MPDTQQSAAGAATATPTRDLAAWIASVKSSEMGDRPRRWAKHAILDWFGVTLAGATDPLVGILAEDALDSGEAGASRLVGRSEKVSPSFAAMINGAASHALDYDDVNKRLHGHPTVPVVPAVLALAEQKGLSGKDVVEAFIVGYEIECLIGEMMGMSHYDHGWHATATVGTFGAAAGCARMLGLDSEKSAMALGIAATQAAGLKSMFGTMCKPLHAGKAAMNGLMAARWAARGFTSRADALDLLQELFLRGARGELLVRYEPERGRLRTYLLTCLGNLRKKDWRAQRARPEHGALSFLAESAPPEPAAGDPEETFELEWRRCLQERAIEAVREGLRAERDELALRVLDAWVLRPERPPAEEVAAEESSVRRRARVRRDHLPATVFRDEVDRGEHQPTEARAAVHLERHVEGGTDELRLAGAG